MSSFAQLSPTERLIYFNEAAANKGVSPVIVEKDFWVVWILSRLFALPDLCNRLVFKGGTSLSKVFSAINRFSEDVDLSVNPSFCGFTEDYLNNAPSSNQTQKRMKELQAACSERVQRQILPMLNSDIEGALGKTVEGGCWVDFRVDTETKSPVGLFKYPPAIEGEIVYISKIVKLEFGSLTNQIPNDKHSISAMVADLVPGQFDDFSAEVIALEFERTFWEKATILHAEYHQPEDKLIKDRFSRHFSDFAALWKHPYGQVAKTRFDLLREVVSFKSRFFPSKTANYGSAVPGTLRLAPPDFRMEELREDYKKMLPMFLTDPPSFDNIMKTMKEAEEDLNRI
jgi:hypothetical protein